jgi:hypothetical protein
MTRFSNLAGAATPPSALRYWEIRRIWYNVALTPAAFFGYCTSTLLSFAVGDIQYLDGREVLAYFIFSAVGVNICYSFAYLLEFWLGGDDRQPRWHRGGRTRMFVSGTILAVLLAIVCGHCIGEMQFTHPGR